MKLKTPSRNVGFTLIEVQIGLLLLVLIIGLVYGALNLAIKSTEKSANAIDKTESMRIISQFMQKQIAQIHPLYWVDRSGNQPIFHGNEQGFVFTAPLVASSSPELLYLQRFSGKKSHQGVSLEFAKRAFEPTRTPQEQEADLVSSPLLDNLHSVTFQYFGENDPTNNQTDWHERWTSKKKLPLLIKCEIAITEEQSWPALFMPIRVDDVSTLSQFKIQAPNTNSSRSRQRLDENITDAD